MFKSQQRARDYINDLWPGVIWEVTPDRATAHPVDMNGEPMAEVYRCRVQ